MYHRLWILIALLGTLHADPLFNGITLTQFGASENLNVPLQPANRFNPNQPLRTNDFQALQQTAATDRQIVRMGQFYVSQGISGPGITLPANQLITQEAITTPTENSRLIFGAAEAQGFNQSTNLLTTQALLVTYTIPGGLRLRPEENPLSNDATLPLPIGDTPPDFSIVDYNIIGSAFHDLQYTLLTPVINFEGATIERIFVDDRLASLFGRLPEGSKFKIETTVQNEALGITQPGPTWLIYVERSTSGITFTVDTLLQRLTASRPLSGFLRIAAIQTTTTPSSNQVPVAQPVGAFWSTAIIQQTRPATPTSMYMLWPRQWVQLVSNQIETQVSARNNIPSCDFFIDLLPVLAKQNFPLAEQFFRQIPFTQYSDTNNPFVTFFMMLAASKLAVSIDNYQANAFPTPQTTNPNAAAVETAFDAQRSVIPISAGVEFGDGIYSWRYRCLDDVTDPLIIYPAYKALDDAFSPAPGFVHQDAIKGPLQAVTARNQRVTFQVAPIPGFFQNSFFPPLLTLSSSEKSRLLQIYREASVLDQTITARNLADAGPQVYNIALTVQCADYVFEQGGTPPFGIRSATEILINRVKQAFSEFLIRRSAADAFVGDSLTGGIVSSLGIDTTTERGAARADDNNGVYSNHHTQYGYWLAAAAVIAEWDAKYNSQNPFVNQQLTLSGITVKDLIDMLWRDARNPDREDPDLPFNRHGNPWEAHSTATGTLYSPLEQGREQANWALDFHSWMGTREWARQVLADTTLSAVQTMGFDRLQAFAETNMGMTVSSTELIYQDKNWIYPTPYDVNLTVGNVFDSATISETELQPGTPACGVAL